ncbi:ABC transporter substrate-binding protein [Paenibacillus baekrokdamisoli]|uniref:ABC transporter substrate-binding protein n=1 Tax=Paenibacillus baekrokdamisoli TaxID=1712516 RepID=A0A3G9J6N9_9BACL|nr:extracellular solute-binding protein [Paenibacillus baekrokdamisoli]MBB3067366.1 ABC-type glycerol-3-phosphate transport system substrate-binding protein [Paenibacillus baekrokdamisoli]BBH19448.1 ABC transporter substrate-binding protein [Paenibacillus baekrokdamisoli]
MQIKRYKRLLFVVVLALLVFSSKAVIFPRDHASGEPIQTEHSQEPVNNDGNFAETADSLPRYEQYIARYSDAPHPASSIVIDAKSFSGTDGMKVNVLDSFQGASSSVVQTDETGSIHWDVNIQEEGLYQIGIRYFPIAGNSSPIERELLIDGEAPFDEAKRLSFSRVWGNEQSNVIQDANGNDLRPKQIEKPEWQQDVIKDPEGYHNEPLSFYMTTGKHRITFVSLREPMVIDNLQLFQAEQIPSYADTKKQYETKGLKDTKTIFVKVQGEDASKKSNPSLYPLNDRSSPATEPYHVSKIRMNTIGGVNWKIPGQWLSWDIEVPEDGLYQLGLRYKQNLARGVNVTRKLFIDDKLPFKEAETIPFEFGGKWQVKLTGGDDPYAYYLTKGKHQIKLEVSMGELADAIRKVRASIQMLNSLYLKVIMITSAKPDQFRDYQLEKQIPELVNVLLAQGKILNQAADQMDRMIGGKSENATVLRTTAYQMNDIGHNPETLAVRMKQFKDNVSALGAWLLLVNQQPLEIDYLFLKSSDVKTPKANTGFFSNLEHEFGSFWHSFTEDYNSVGSRGNGTDSINVWMSGGRDQAQLLRSLIDASFTPKTGIQVNLKLVDGKAVLPAVLSGKGPDVAIETLDVINFAMRNALQDLSQMPNFDKVQKRFMDSAFDQFKFKDGVYAIPEKQQFAMMFYRKDVFKLLNLKVPETWQDMYHLIPELQKHNMEFGVSSIPVFQMLLYQNGGQYYQGDGIATDLDSKAGVTSFRKWTELYTNYKLPLEFNFINRFRTGEMPIGIDMYSTFNFLTIFAPEIRGQWGFVPVPGTMGPDGTIHREELSTSTGTVMLKDAKNKEAAWKFIDWWTDTEAQVSFGREIEAILGESGRYEAANLEALKQLPWAARDYKQIMDQLKWVKGVPAVPGGYSLDRHLQNAFYEVYNQGSDPRETLENYVRIINEELTLKRKEFHLSTK